MFGKRNPKFLKAKVRYWFQNNQKNDQKQKKIF